MVPSAETETESRFFLTKGLPSTLETIAVLAAHQPFSLFRFVSLHCLRSTLRLVNRNMACGNDNVVVLLTTSRRICQLTSNPPVVSLSSPVEEGAKHSSLTSGHRRQILWICRSFNISSRKSCMKFFPRLLNIESIALVIIPPCFALICQGWA